MAPTEQPGASAPGGTSGAGSRGARPAAPAPSFPAKDCWAFIVGISTYAHKNDRLCDLRYARPDAEAMAVQLGRAYSGNVDRKTRMVVLLDQEATRDRIVGDLREFLRRPAAGDLVVLYFAGHGMPDPDPELSTIAYLVAHDTDVRKIARDGVPMREIHGSIADYLKRSCRVVLLADTCYSGALLEPHPGRRGPEDEAERARVARRFFNEVGRSPHGTTSVLASANAWQGAQEGPRWDGHGVFTYYLLKGLNGDADRNRDNCVTVDELFAYVREHVVNDTGGAQKPVISPDPPPLILAYTAGLAADEHLKIGKAILEMGLLLDDKDRFAAATSELEDALRAARDSRRHLPEAEAWYGVARLMAGDTQDAIAVLTEAAARDERGHPRLHYYLGLAQIIAGDRAGAVAALERFQSLVPDELRASWPSQFVAGLMAAGPGRRRAVLIGVQSHQHLPAIRLQGPRNDLHLMRDVLEQRCGFRADDIQVLFDEDATHDRVLGELAALARSAQATDVILIYFTGHSTSGSREEYLFVHDTRTPPDDPAAAASPWTAAELHDTITSRELHDALERITAASKLLILDTHPNDTFVNLARRSSSYAVLLASSPNESTYEYPFEQQGKPLQAGLLTYTLVQRLKDTGPHVTRAAFVAGLIEDVHTRRMDQTPYFLGNTGLPLLPHDRETSAGLLVELSLRRAYGALDRSWLAEIYDRAVTGLADVAFPDLHLSAGRAFLTLGDPVRAGDALERAHDQTRTPPPDLLAPLGITRIAAGRYDEALDVARRLAVAVGLPGMEDAVVPLVEQLRAQSGCALIVGIHDYQGPEQEIPSERETSSEAAADGNARRMAAFLVEHARFAPERVRVLLNQGARRRAILEAFEWLCKEAGGGPAVFYFAGNGSMQGNEGRPTLVSHDGRTDGVFDISLDELAQLARSSGANLVGLLDAGFRPGPRGRAVAGGRFVPRDLRPVPSTRDVRMRDDVVDRDDSEQDHAPLHGVMPVIGVATGFYSADTRTFSFVGAGAQRFQEALRARPAADDEPLWLANWLAASPAGDAGEFAAQFARNRVIEERMVAEFQRAERYPFEQAVVLLGNLIHKHDNEDPERLVSRGVAYGLLGDTSRARDDLDAARKLLKRADRPCFEAHYHHGRLLVESHREPERAVNELRHAVDEAPDHAGARYYLGEAILQMIKQQSQEEIKKHWDRYLELGAPLGHQAKITAFLRK